MRAYTFTNFMLSPIQQGIQPAHCLIDLFVKYQYDVPARNVLFDWAANHKTMICLNGGNADGIRGAYETVTRIGDALQLPYGYFREDEQSLDSSMTSVGIIVPERIYNISGLLLAGADPSQFSELEIELADFLRNHSLAR